MKGRLGWVYKQWFGKVVASEESIKAAIIGLGRQPKNAKELQEILDRNRKKATESMLEEINKELPQAHPSLETGKTSPESNKSKPVQPKTKKN